MSAKSGRNCELRPRRGSGSAVRADHAVLAPTPGIGEQGHLAEAIEFEGHLLLTAGVPDVRTLVRIIFGTFLLPDVVLEIIVRKIG